MSVNLNKPPRRKTHSGVTAIEYGLIAALISVAAIIAMQGLSYQAKSNHTNDSGLRLNGNNVACTH